MRRVKYLSVLLIAVLLVGLLSACAGMADEIIIVAGSTSVQPYAEILSEEYALEHANIEIDVQGGGSSAGITAVLSGTANIGMSSRALKESEQDLWSVEIAKDGLAMIIHPNNPVKDLTLAQIRDIYTGTLTNWREVGGNDAKIHVITREEGSGTRSAFEELVMEKERITPRAIVQDSNGAVRQLVCGDLNSIGFISLGLVGIGEKPVRALALGGIEATWENVSDGSYTLFRPFLFVCAAEPGGQAKKFIDFVLSEKGQQMLIHEGLIPKGGETK